MNIDNELPVTPEAKLLRDVLWFRLEFMLMMHAVGRTDEADKMLGKLQEAILQVKGNYKA